MRERADRSGREEIDGRGSGSGAPGWFRVSADGDQDGTDDPTSPAATPWQAGGIGDDGEDALDAAAAVAAPEEETVGALVTLHLLLTLCLRAGFATSSPSMLHALPCCLTIGSLVHPVPLAVEHPSAKESGLAEFAYDITSTGKLLAERFGRDHSAVIKSRVEGLQPILLAHPADTVGGEALAESGDHSVPVEDVGNLQVRVLLEESIDPLHDPLCGGAILPRIEGNRRFEGPRGATPIPDMHARADGDFPH